MKVLVITLLALFVVCQGQSFSERASAFFDGVGNHVERLKQRASNQWGNPGKAGFWGRTLFVPGHTLDAKSWKQMIEYGASYKGNGEYAAVFDARNGRWFANSIKGRELSAKGVRSTNMYIVNFSDRFGSTPRKAIEIRKCVLALRKAWLSSSQALSLNVVTHSAGDADFDLALVEELVTRKMIRIPKRIAIGPVFDGTYVGSLGGQVLGRMGSLGRRLGAQAANELAEESKLIDGLVASQDKLNAGIYKGTMRVDILANGIAAITPRLDEDSLAAGDGFVQSGRHRPFVEKTFVVNAVDPTALNHLLQVGFKAVLQKVNEVLIA